jgi:hypothetical protein
MTLYLVTVEPGKWNRTYFDSIWVKREHADERQRQLHDELNRVGFPIFPESSPTADRWHVTVTEAHCRDGELKEGPGRGRPRAAKAEA